MKRFMIVSLLMALPLAAQEPKKSEENKPLVQKLFILKYADPGQIRPLLSVFGANVTPNSDLHALAVVSSAEIMPAIEDAIKRLDVPAAAPQNIELTAYFLIGGDGDTVPGGPVPKELDSVVTQLKNSFAFKNYHLMDALTLRTRSGQSADTSSSPGAVTAGLPSATTQFRIQSASLSADSATVRIDKMRAGVRMPTSNTVGPNVQYSFVDLGLNADVDVKEGQKVVVGRLSVNKDQALFLVLTARVVN